MLTNKRDLAVYIQPIYKVGLGVMHINSINSKIFNRIFFDIIKMIIKLVKKIPKLTKQKGKIVVFKRYG